MHAHHDVSTMHAQVAGPESKPDPLLLFLLCACMHVHACQQQSDHACMLHYAHILACMLRHTAVASSCLHAYVLALQDPHNWFFFRVPLPAYVYPHVLRDGDMHCAAGIKHNLQLWWSGIQLCSCQVTTSTSSSPWVVLAFTGCVHAFPEAQNSRQYP
jgi:hypothetical protein